jgi:twitching motility protein PilT
MQTFDQSLMYLLEKGLITYEEALLQCSNPDDFALKVRGIYSTSDDRWEGFEAKVEMEQEEQGEAREETPSQDEETEDMKIERFDK